MKTLTPKGLINTLAASGNNVYTDTVARNSMIVALNTADPLVPVIPFKIKTGTVKSVDYISSAAEVRREWLIGGADAEVVADWLRQALRN